jgi:branched-chain amino acid transport system substrate-binding protein
VAQLIPLSGVEKALGQQAQQGARLAVEELNRADPSAAERPLGVLHVDTRSEVEAVAPEAVRVLRINKAVAFLGGVSPAQAEPLVRTARDYGVPVITSGAPPSPQLGDFGFCVGLSAAARGKALAVFAIREKPAPLAVLTDEQDRVAQETAAAFARQFASEGRALLIERTYQAGADFAEVAGRLQKLKEAPRAVLIAGGTRDFVKWRGHLEKAGLRVPLLFGGDEAGATALLADREASQGVVLATAYAGVADNPRARDFTLKYQEHFGSAPTVHAALAYDAARLLGQAYLEVIPPEPAKIRDHLAGLSAYESLTGPLSFDKDHYTRRAVFVVRAEDGELKLVQRTEPKD